MSADVAVLLATAVLAVVAVVAAVVAVVTARRVARASVATRTPAVPQTSVPRPAPTRDDAGPGPDEHPDARPARVVDVVPSPSGAAVRTGELEPRVLEGRIVVPPTQDQVVAAALSRPQARLAVVAQGVAHALRPESRDRIGALVRREYRNRRRERLRAGRRAARAAHRSDVPTPAADQWLGER